MKLIHQKIVKKETFYIESESVDKNKNHIKNLEASTVLTLEDRQIFKTSIDIKEKEGQEIVLIANSDNQIESLLTLEFENKLLEDTKPFDIELFLKFLMLVIFSCVTFLPLGNDNLSIMSRIVLMGGMFLTLIFCFKMWIEELVDFKKEIKIKKELLSSIISFKSKRKNIKAPDICNIGESLSKNIVDVK